MCFYYLNYFIDDWYFSHLAMMKVNSFVPVNVVYDSFGCCIFCFVVPFYGDVYVFTLNIVIYFFLRMFIVFYPCDTKWQSWEEIMEEHPCSLRGMQQKKRPKIDYEPRELSSLSLGHGGGGGGGHLQTVEEKMSVKRI